MRNSAFMAAEALARLRRQIARIEGQTPLSTFGQTSDFSPVSTPAEAHSVSPLPLRERVLSLGAAQPSLETKGEEASPSLPTPPPHAPPTLAPRRTGATLPFAIPKLDALLTGGLRRAALHELRTEESRNAAAMTGFAVALLARLGASDTRPILWVIETQETSETGLPYGNGLAAFGLDPARLIIVRVAKPADALWVFEEGLRCRGLAAVVTEMAGHPRLLDLTASRRLALRAREHGVMGLLLRHADRAEPGAANTRWLIAPRPAATDEEFPDGIGDPTWRLTLERNRQGATGAFDVEWNHERQSFALAAPASPRPLPAVSRDRPPPPPEQGKIMALPRRIADEPLPREEKRRRLRSRG
jgi:protein ImuA